MIHLTNIEKSFGSLEVLKGIDLEINKGEVVSIVGPSGAGKTTLLQIMGTLDRPDSGKVIVDGVDVSTLSQKKLSDFRNQHVGFVFQFHQLLPEFTALENIMIPAFIAGKSQKEAKRRALELLDFMGLTERAEHKPNELSGGEKQRVAVARALVNNPAVILADEPSGSLDTKNKGELHQLFFDLRDKFGQTFVIVTHDEQLASITDRTIHMKDGRILEEGGI
ncbi:ABC transporter ATP-binding protein [Prevotella sp. P2-180]|uniref:ABC transporter ATP-binding protein n=1 Tax=Prevotella sp. P2-180 TaxID=2024224 RepID=UPI000B95FB90|nr:ABC transporter ATP-binding protein [Prevotella sp. P2-180]MCI7089780.1 ABC transporter ATP-binding protein [Prevotella sp.]MDD5785196.1 ABC transporter ATP-binding protein [Prevotella sp.]MDD6863495.1 ABC transporter ATP-binding protein [Prevotella sp.]MDD7224707.1 ABC transporter ATP-binding protein [Prevotella sp.]MDY4498641.1 ABC transporter ATP-binding protein [Prevotella sp.]